MPYGQIKGRRPFERASKIAHSEVIKNKLVQEFVANCELPDRPPAEDLASKTEKLPEGVGEVSTVIAIDGGLTETWVRQEVPTASIAFITLGPLLLRLKDLEDLDRQPFIGPEDMRKLKNIQRYNLVIPTKCIRVKGSSTFSQGVRRRVHEFLTSGDGHLMRALAWLLFEEWRGEGKTQFWEIPRCPNGDCDEERIRFRSTQPVQRTCARCEEIIYLSDGLRLYERIDEEMGAGGILSYLLTALEQIVLVHLIKSVWDLKPSLLREILFVKDGPLAFFGVTAPFYRPMRELMRFLGAAEGGPLLNLVGLEKSGPFVEHAALIEGDLASRDLLVLDSDYIYRHVVPGDPLVKEFGKNTYYGAKVIFKGGANDTYVATVPTLAHKKAPTFGDLLNGTEVLNVTARLRCSMYDNALVPVVLANKLVSLADVPSSEILAKFVRDKIRPA